MTALGKEGDVAGNEAGEKETTNFLIILLRHP